MPSSPSMGSRPTSRSPIPSSSGRLFDLPDSRRREPESGRPAAIRRPDRSRTWRDGPRLTAGSGPDEVEAAEGAGAGEDADPVAAAVVVGVALDRPELAAVDGGDQPGVAVGP